MPSLEIDRVLRFAGAVRTSSLKRLRSVPGGRENWRPAPTAMSFADVARHLVDADDWLLRKLEDPELRPMSGHAGVVQIDHRRHYVELLAQLEESGRRRQARLRALTEAELEVTLPDERFGGPVTIWWLIVRGSLDHEIHHRGQISAYLRALGVEPAE